MSYSLCLTVLNENKVNFLASKEGLTREPNLVFMYRNLSNKVKNSSKLSLALFIVVHWNLASTHSISIFEASCVLDALDLKLNNRFWSLAGGHGSNIIFKTR